MNSVIKWIRKITCIVSNVVKDPGMELSWIYSKYCRVKKNKIVFSSYAGGGYCGSPKYISDEIIRNKLPWNVVWLLKDTSLELPKGIRKVKYGSPRARCEIASSQVVISNIRSDNRPPKKEGQIYIQTWHGGIGFKYAEKAVEDKLDKEYVQWAKVDGQNCDAILSNCLLQSEDYRKNYWLNPKTEILEYGLPRNDLLFDHAFCAEKFASVRREYGFTQNQKIILYMPTFRVDHSMAGYALDFERILSAMEKRTGEQFAFIIRLHPNVQSQADHIPYNEKIVNGSRYDDVQELYMAADYLITDYSSAALDFALLEKPVFLCMLDYEEYVKDRGVNEIFDMCPFPHTYSNDELLLAMENFSYENYARKMKDFMKIWQPFEDGHAAQRVVEWMKARMGV